MIFVFVLQLQLGGAGALGQDVAGHVKEASASEDAHVRMGTPAVEPALRMRTAITTYRV